MDRNSNEVLGADVTLAEYVYRVTAVNVREFLGTKTFEFYNKSGERLVP